MRSRWRARSRCWATVPSLPATAALAEPRRAQRGRCHARAGGAEILRAEPPLGFVHALVRDAVYHDLSVAERELRHERAAKALADLGAAPEVVAGHLLLVPSRGEPWVADVLREAGLAGDASRGRRERGVLPAARAGGTAGRRGSRAAAAGSLDLCEAHVDSAAAAERLREVHDLLDGPAAASAGRRRACAVAAVDASGPGSGGRRSARNGGARGDARRSAAGARGDRAATRSAFGGAGAGLPPRGWRACAPPVSRSGWARSMLAAVAAWDWALRRRLRAGVLRVRARGARRWIADRREIPGSAPRWPAWCSRSPIMTRRCASGRRR